MALPLLPVAAAVIAVHLVEDTHSSHVVVAAEDKVVVDIHPTAVEVVVVAA